ncbi:MAG: hypothetical protein H8E27_08200 [Verrucomicrobia subdivision 3 bacterium]|nr:hypothetical protein [Limisphaerales bacterium]
MKTTLFKLIALTSLAALPARAEVTFTQDVAPIIFNNCTSCHRAGEAAPFELINFNDVRKRGRLIARVTEDRVMPPWHAKKSSFAFHGDRRLSDKQIKTISQWVEAGMPEGDAAQLPPLPKFTAGWQLGKPDLIVKMTEPFSVPAEGRDIYRSFVVPLNLPNDKWLKAVEFRPGARAVVHHCLFSYDTTGEARQLDAADRQPGFRRMRRQGRGVGSLGGWAVGGQPRPLPADLAWHLPKTADLVLNMHYHPSGKPEMDQSTIGFYFTDKPPRTAFTGVQLPPAFGALSGVDIPPGDKAYKVTDSFTLPIAVEAFAISAHAHYLGKHLQMTATLPTGKQLDLLNIPDWDFSWQEQYQFKEFIQLPKGTRLDSTVIWDNSAANPNNPSVPPSRVRWGVESDDEMGCLTLLCRPAPGERYATLTSAYFRHFAEVRTRTAREMAARAQGPNGDRILDAFLRRNDRNRNGKIDLNEAPRWLQPAFDRADKNKDKALDAAELKAARDRLRINQ